VTQEVRIKSGLDSRSDQFFSLLSRLLQTRVREAGPSLSHKRKETRMIKRKKNRRTQ
jgi:hypothetical protein